MTSYITCYIRINLSWADLYTSRSQEASEESFRVLYNMLCILSSYHVIYHDVLYNIKIMLHNKMLYIILCYITLPGMLYSMWCYISLTHNMGVYVM